MKHLQHFCSHSSNNNIVNSKHIETSGCLLLVEGTSKPKWHHFWGTVFLTQPVNFKIASHTFFMRLPRVQWKDQYHSHWLETIINTESLNSIPGVAYQINGFRQRNQLWRKACYCLIRSLLSCWSSAPIGPVLYWTDGTAKDRLKTVIKETA